MPVRSEAQRRLMYAVEEGKVADVPKRVGTEFIDASHGLKDLPERVHHRKHLPHGFRHITTSTTTRTKDR